MHSLICDLRQIPHLSKPHFLTYKVRVTLRHSRAVAPRMPAPPPPSRQRHTLPSMKRPGKLTAATESFRLQVSRRHRGTALPFPSAPQSLRSPAGAEHRGHPGGGVPQTVSAPGLRCLLVSPPKSAERLWRHCPPALPSSLPRAGLGGGDVCPAVGAGPAQVLTAVPDSGVWSGNPGYSVPSRFSARPRGRPAPSPAGSGHTLLAQDREMGKPPGLSAPAEHCAVPGTVLAPRVQHEDTVSASREPIAGERDLVREF